MHTTPREQLSSYGNHHMDRRDPDLESSRTALQVALDLCSAQLDGALEHVDRPAMPDTSLEPLRRAVRDFAQAAANEGIPPERVLATFKAMATQVPRLAKRRMDDRNRIIRQLVEMTIEAYYADG